MRREHLRLALGAVGLAHLERADLRARACARSLSCSRMPSSTLVDRLAQALELVAHVAQLDVAGRRGSRARRGCARCARSPRARRRCRGRRACTPSRPCDLLTMLWMLRPACAIVVEIWPDHVRARSRSRWRCGARIRAPSPRSGNSPRCAIVALLEELAQLVHHHDRAVLLGFLGGGAEVRQRQHAGRGPAARATGKSVDVAAQALLRERRRARPPRPRRRRARS